MRIIGKDWEEPFHECSLEAKALATMFYPESKDVEKRQKLAAEYHVENLIVIAQAADARNINLTMNEFMLLPRARSVDDLGNDYAKLVLRGFYAAHWLRFRLYASQQSSKLASNNKWEFYFDFDIIFKLPELAARHRNWRSDARAHYAPVAHLWAAWFDRRPGLRYFRPPSVHPALRSREETKVNFDFLGRAKGYFQAASQANLYSGKKGLPAPNTVWRLPDSVVADPPRDLTTPDALVPDFDPEFLHDEYFPVRVSKK